MTILSAIATGNCEYSFTAALSGGNPSDYCYEWTLNGVSIATTATVNHTFECNDDSQYELCVRVICCDTGEVAGNACIGFTPECECPCEPPSAFQIASSINADNCEYTFEVDPFLISTNDYCVTWSLDGGPFTSDFTPSDVTYNFDCNDNGGHFVCARVFCCDDPDVFVERCIDFAVDCDCPCEIPGADEVDIVPTNDECEYTFTPFLAGVQLDYPYCWDWIYDGSTYTGVTNPDGSLTIDFTGVCTEFEIGIKVYCCDDQFPAGNGSFETITIDCCCDPTDLPTGTLLIDDIAGTCSYTAAVSFPVGTDVDDLCFSWFLDGVPVISGNGPFHTFDFDCTQNGGHVICVQYTCCDNPGEPIEICRDIFVDCPCTHPFLVVADVTDCTACLTPIYEGPCPAPVVFVDYGDGTTGTDLCHEYSTPGVYTACITTCCESNIDAAGNPIDPTDCQTICTDIVIENACCEVPDDLFISVSKDENCLHFFDLGTFTGDLGSDLCVQWSLNGAPYVNSPDGFSYTHQFDCFDQIVNTICARVYCCENPEESVIVCETFEINCPCILPSSIGFDYTITDDCNLFVSPFWTDDYCGACFEWTVDGVVVGDETTTIIPLSGSGVYNVCFTAYCCNNPEDRITECRQIEVNCCDEDDLSPSIDVQQDGCIWTFTPMNNGVPLIPGVDCYDWELASLAGPDGSVTLDMTQYCPGFFGVCIEVWCCEDEDIRLGLCVDYIVDCCECPEPSLDDYFTAIDLDTDCYDWRFNNDVDDLDINNDYCYMWCVDGTVVSTSTDLDYTFPADGTYDVCLKVFCCETWEFLGQYCETIEIDCDPCPHECDVHAFWQETVSGNTVTFTDFSVTGPGTVITGWYWTFGDGNTSTLQNPVHTYATSGTYTVNLTVYAVYEDGTECESHFCWTVTTECDSDCGVDALFDYDYNFNTCQVQFVDLSSFSSGTSIIDWNWNFGDGNTSTSPNPVHTYATSGTYVVTLTVTGWNGNTICTDTYQIEISVECDQQTECLGEPYFKWKTQGCFVRFYDYSAPVAPGVITSITWSFGDGTVVPFGPSVIDHVYPSSGTYLASVTIHVDMGGYTCTLTHYDTVTVNCGIIANDDDIALGLSTNDLNVYPNPTSSNVTLDLTGWDKEELVTVKVTTVTGELVKTITHDLENGPAEVSLEEFETGLYNISVSNSREILTSRVVKE